MSFKELVEKELVINPKIKYPEASLRIPNLKEKTFNNVRTEWRKINGNIPDPEPELKEITTFLKTPGIIASNKLDKSSKNRKKLSSEYLEKLLINALDNNPNNANLIGKAIDFFVKVRDKEDGMEEDLDMEGFLTLGKLGAKYNPELIGVALDKLLEPEFQTRLEAQVKKDLKT